MQAHPVHSARKGAKGFPLIPLRILLAVAAVIAVSMRSGDEAAHNDHSSGPTDGWFGQRSGQASFDPGGLSR